MQQLYASEAGATPLKVTPAFSPDVLPDVSATRSADGAKITLFAVNPTRDILDRTLDLSAFGKGVKNLRVWTISDHQGAGEPDVTNNFDDPDRVTAVASAVRADSAPEVRYRFPRLSVTCIQFAGR
jgi:alpha-L-arabinofuranosidase